MMTKKPKTVIIITTYDLDALRVSVPPLRGFRRDATLVIHNDNPAQKLLRRDVVKLGWRGNTHIINSDNNLGEFESRIRAIEYVRDNKILADWIVLVDDDDVLIDVCVPNVSNNVFAIIQNTTTLSANHIDMFRINHSWADGTEYGKTGPKFAITGTMIRANILFEFVDTVRTVMPQIRDAVGDMKYRISWDLILWNMLDTFVRTRHPDMSPIYMNRTNYVAIKLGRAPIKYGLKNLSGAVAATTTDAASKKICEIIEFATAQNMVAHA